MLLIRAENNEQLDLKKVLKLRAGQVERGFGVEPRGPIGDMLYTFLARTGLLRTDEEMALSIVLTRQPLARHQKARAFLARASLFTFSLHVLRPHRSLLPELFSSTRYFVCESIYEFLHRHAREHA